MNSKNMRYFLTKIVSNLQGNQGSLDDLQKLLLLKQARKQLADFYLNCSSQELQSLFEQDLGEIHRCLMYSDIKYYSLTDEEKKIVIEAVDYISKGLGQSQTVPYLMVLMLYQRAEQALLPYDLEDIPAWLLLDYLNFICKPPSLFQYPDEVEHYYYYLSGWIYYVHDRILSGFDSKNSATLETWNTVINFFAQNTNFIPLYFTRQNLKEVLTKRAEIIEAWLVLNDAQIDYEFPERDPNRTKTRVGVLKSHFIPQTETFLTIPAFEHLDRNQFEIILYAPHLTNTDPIEQYCRSRADDIVHLQGNFHHQVQRIREDDLDVLIIGNNITAVTNLVTLLASHRLARVQTTLYSSPVTTGIRNIDYYISGNLTEPLHNAQSHYREELVMLEGPGYCFNYVSEPGVSSSVPTRDNLGIDKNAVVYISGANFYKVIPEVREVWTKILVNVPNSILVLYPFSPSWSNSYEAKEFLKCWFSSFAKYEVKQERLIILPAMKIRADVKQCLSFSDIYLDSLPYTGSFSVSDALEVGLPPIVMDGDTLRSRQGAALLRAFQMSELIVDNEAAYIELAVRLGKNPELRQQKREHIRQKMGDNPVFFDSRAYSVQIGNLLKDLFEKFDANRLRERFRLREMNLVVFPDWNQPESELFETLVNLLRFAFTKDGSRQHSLLIYIGESEPSEADMAISSIMMHLMVEAGIEVSDKSPEIVLVTPMDESRWRSLLPHLAARISLETEDRAAIEKVGAVDLPLCKISAPALAIT